MSTEGTSNESALNRKIPSWNKGPIIPSPLIEPWPMAQHDSAHSSLGTYQAPTNPYLKWQFQSPWQLSVPIVDSENVFVASIDGTLHALNPSNGTENWGAPLSNGFAPWQPTPAPAISNKEPTVYAVSATSLAAFDKASGNVLWNTFLGNIPWDPYVAPDGTIVVTGQGGVWSVNSKGSLNWSIPTDPTLVNQPSTPPTIGPDGEIYFGTLNPVSIVCLNSAGNLLWEIWEVPSPEVYYPLTLNIQDPSGMSVYAANGTGVIAYSASDGSQRWNYQVAVSGALAVDSNSGQVYVPANDGSLVTLRLDGSLAWKAQLSSNALCTPSVDSSSVVLVGDITGMVYALDSSGNRLWSYGASLSGRLWNSLTSIGTEQTVYASGLYSVTALAARSQGKSPSGPVANSPYTPGEIALLPSYIAYLMSQGMSLTQALEAILSGFPPPVTTGRGPAPKSYPAYLSATNTMLNGARSIMLSLTVSGASGNRLADDGLRMMEEGLRQLGNLGRKP
jgi:outer membrane protein assembly factor BamB